MTQWQDLTVDQNNDVTFSLSLTFGQAPFDATGYTLSLILKPSETAADNTGTTFTVGNGLTVVSTKLGEVTWDLPHASTATPGQQWWRIDAVDGGGDRTTLMFGHLNVMAV